MMIMKERCVAASREVLCIPSTGKASSTSTTGISSAFSGSVSFMSSYSLKNIDKWCKFSIIRLFLVNNYTDITKSKSTATDTDKYTLG